jgi:hypothetical protein
VFVLGLALVIVEEDVVAEEEVDDVVVEVVPVP